MALPRSRAEPHNYTSSASQLYLNTASIVCTYPNPSSGPVITELKKSLSSLIVDFLVPILEMSSVVCCAVNASILGCLKRLRDYSLVDSRWDIQNEYFSLDNEQDGQFLRNVEAQHEKQEERCRQKQHVQTLRSLSRYRIYGIVDHVDVATQMLYAMTIFFSIACPWLGWSLMPGSLGTAGANNIRNA